MLNSRDIGKLRVDVADNCRIFLDRCQKAGQPVLITGTVRDDAYQLQCYQNGTGGKPPATFHSVKAGLAFDICKNVKGEEYSDPHFWAAVSVIGKQMGFTWGGDWTSFVDKPHFQWDAHGKYSGKDIIAGKYPPPMPLYQSQEEDDMTEKEVQTIVRNMLSAQANPTYDTLAEVPDWGKATVEKLQKMGAINGTDKGLDLTYEQLRILVIQDRAGLYQK